MNYSIYRFTLDIHRTKSQVSIPVLFHDTGIQFYISLTDGGKPYFIEDGCRAVFSAKKPDGATLFNDCIIEDNTRIRYDFTEQTTNCEGMMNCEIRLYGTDGNLLTTPAFVVVVDPRVIYDSEVLDSYPEATLLDNMVSAENARLVGEQKRVDAEAVRVIVENARAAAEAERIAAENARAAAEVERGDAETERIANEAERVAAYAHMIGSWVAYSAHEDGTDYTWTWSEGQRYIGICNGKTPPQDKTGFVWSKFVDTGIYVGSGDMPSWCDLQIDPDGDVTEIVQTPGQSPTNVMSQKAVSDNFANALAGSASGEMVVLDDVSPIAHEMAVSVRGKNLIDAARYAGSRNTTIDGDVITTNFENDAVFFNSNKVNPFKAGAYTVSVIPVSGTMYFGLYAYKANAPMETLFATYQERITNTFSYTFTATEDFVLCLGGYKTGDVDGNIGRCVFSYKVQLEEGTTATPYAPYVEDVSSVKVKAFGKNLLDIHNRTKGTLQYGDNTLQRVLETDKYYVGLTRNNYGYPKYVTSAEYVDGVWRISNSAGGYGVAFPVEVKPNTNYFVSISNNYVNVGFYDKDGNFLSYWYTDKYETDGDYFTTPANCAIMTVCLTPSSVNTINEFSNVQLEVGTAATEYEPYKEPVTYAQGEPINSIYPCTTLMTDTAGAVMDVEYNRDANKVVNELAARLAALEAAALN